VLCDVTSRVQVDVLIQSANARLGQTDVLVNNASVSGVRVQHSQSHYAAEKAGVMALTRCSAIDAVEYGVRINAVSPSIARDRSLDTT